MGATTNARPGCWLVAPNIPNAALKRASRARTLLFRRRSLKGRGGPRCVSFDAMYSSACCCVNTPSALASWGRGSWCREVVMQCPVIADTSLQASYIQ